MMQKSSGSSQPISKQLTMQQKMQFPDRINFIKQGKRYLVKQTVKTSSVTFKRVICLDGGDDEVMQLRILQDEVASAKQFTFVD